MYPLYGLLFLATEFIVNRFFVHSPISQQSREYTYAEILQETREGKGLFVLEDVVCDLTKFMRFHPGTQLLREHVGTEIGRYIYGGFPARDGRVQLHSPQAWDIVRAQQCGTVRPAFRLPVAPDSVWHISAREMLTKVHCAVHFTSFLAGRIPAISAGVNLCGMYIRLRSQRLGLTRNYSWSFLASQTMLKKHIELVERADDPAFIPPMNLSMEDTTRDGMEICVKRQRTVSRWLHDKESDSDQFEIDGLFVKCYDAV